MSTSESMALQCIYSASVILHFICTYLTSFAVRLQFYCGEPNCGRLTFIFHLECKLFRHARQRQQPNAYETAYHPHGKGDLMGGLQPSFHFDFMQLQKHLHPHPHLDLHTNSVLSQPKGN